MRVCACAVGGARAARSARQRDAVRLRRDDAAQEQRVVRSRDGRRVRPLAGDARRSYGDCVRRCTTGKERLPVTRTRAPIPYRFQHSQPLPPAF